MGYNGPPPEALVAGVVFAELTGEPLRIFHHLSASLVADFLEELATPIPMPRRFLRTASASAFELGPTTAPGAAAQHHVKGFNLRRLVLLDEPLPRRPRGFEGGDPLLEALAEPVLGCTFPDLLGRGALDRLQDLVRRLRRLVAEVSIAPPVGHQPFVRLDRRPAQLAERRNGGL